MWWSDKGVRHDGFFWKTTNDWQGELALSYAQVRRIEKALVKDGLIEAKKFMANGSMTMHYKPRIEAIIAKIIDITNLEKVEVAESSTSRNSNHQLQETLSSEVQESRSSITGESMRDNMDISSQQKTDYLDSVLSHQSGEENIAASDDWQQHFGYRDEALKLYRELTGQWADAEVGKPAIIELSQTPNFDPGKWKRSIQSARLAGVKKTNIACFIETYHAGGEYKNLFNRDRDNGHHPGNKTEGAPIDEDQLKQLQEQANANTDH